MPRPRPRFGFRPGFHKGDLVRLVPGVSSPRISKGAVGEIVSGPKTSTDLGFSPPSDDLWWMVSWGVPWAHLNEPIYVSDKVIELA
jgi:hypothetical protein